MQKKQKNVVARDLWGKNYKVKTSSLSFRPSVYGIIIKKDKILLSKQFDGYDFPGGGIELGETIEEALLREVWEETGLTVKMGALVHAQNDFFKLINTNQFKHSILLHYLCHNPKGKITTANFDDYEKEYGSAAEWLPVKATKNIKFYNPVKSYDLVKRALKLMK